ncbi:hypothetical protein [Dyadobacter sandarakinus]|uniref:Uncharacterized protein n=1 Tax=Dyadobacter sandarakinus TaxID=2747268 RepID=A0ABX7IB20_9BACT|nr:hypothetical protein [Dyadobacter sandarakinus]QRR03008.1 hypothetical protein HWI92_19885 [Dyadobacter sandarakinus]
MTYHIFLKSRNWDSVLLPLDDHQLDLTFQFRVFLEKIEPTEKRVVLDLVCDGQGHVTEIGTWHKYHIDPWAPGQWEDFERKFRNTVITFWDKQFELVPNQPWLPTRTGLAAATINCGIAVEIVKTSPQQSHVKCEVFNTRAMPKTMRSAVAVDLVPKIALLNRTDVDMDVLHWEPHIFRREPNLTKVNGEPHAVDYFRSVLAHEFGHVLELPHVRGTGNIAGDYGSEDIAYADTIMGMGSRMISKYAEPWLKRLEMHLVRRVPQDPSVRFTARVSRTQLDTHWDHGRLIHVGGALSIPADAFGRP